jgi:hypothetical protein
MGFFKKLKKAAKKLVGGVKKIGYAVDVTSEKSGVRKLGRFVDDKITQPVFNTVKYAILIPFQIPMVAALKAKGIKASLNPLDIEATTHKFYDNIVAKKGSNYEAIGDTWESLHGDSYDDLTDDVIQAVINFIKNGIQGTKTGQKQTDIVKKLSADASKVIVSLQEKAGILANKSGIIPTTSAPTTRTTTPIKVTNPITGESKPKVVATAGGVPIVVPETVLGKELKISPWLIGGVLFTILVGIVVYMISRKS